MAVYPQHLAFHKFFVQGITCSSRSMYATQNPRKPLLKKSIYRLLNAPSPVRTFSPGRRDDPLWVENASQRRESGIARGREGAWPSASADGIWVGNGDRRPLPPNPVCGFPATNVIDHI